MIRIGVAPLAVLFTFASLASGGLPETNLQKEMKLLLERQVKFAGCDDPKVTFGEQFEELGVQYDLQFDIDEKAFAEDGVEDVLKLSMVSESRPLPKLKSVRFETVLRKILARIPNESGAIYLIKRDRIQITTRRAVFPDSFRNSPKRQLPVVSCEFEKKPLAEALKELDNTVDFNIVLDVRMAESAKAPVTARLDNVPLDTAVQLLADMADLRAVLIDNVFYVTVKENARALEAERVKRIGGDPEKKLTEEKPKVDPKEAALLAEKQARAGEIRAKLKEWEAQLEKLQAEIDRSKK
jgi:hypothetical protein